jgi:hypothetical protein
MRTVIGMTQNEHERIDAGWGQPTSAAAQGNSAAGFEFPHPHRPYYTGADLDPMARLEWLDDLMFAAIEGDPVALDYAAEAWHKTCDELGDTALEESRLQYMRRAQTVWYALRSEPDHPPHKVFAAIEIISLLATKARAS